MSPAVARAYKQNAYILATDADVRFEPADVKALHTLLSRYGSSEMCRVLTVSDKRVGAVCGRTFPIGHGPLVWCVLLWCCGVLTAPFFTVCKV